MHAEADAESLRRKVRDATERLEANERQLARLRDALDAGAKAAETAANDASAEASEARAETRRLEADFAKERDAREAAERVAAETRETLARVSDAAGRQLETLREEVDVLRARLSAQGARDRDAADADATIATLRRRLDESTAGVDGVVARALRRANAQLRNALNDAPGWTDSDEGRRADASTGAFTTDDPSDVLASNALVPAATKARLAGLAMPAEEAESLSAKVEAAAETLAARLASLAADREDLDRRVDAASKFEAGAASLRERLESAEAAAKAAAEAREEAERDAVAARSRAPADARWHAVAESGSYVRTHWSVVRRCRSCSTRQPFSRCWETSRKPP